MKAMSIKKGMVVELNGGYWLVQEVEVKTPSSRGAPTLYKVRFSNVKTRQKLQQNFKGSDVLKESFLNRLEVQFIYKDGDIYTFMDLENYSHYNLTADDLEGQKEWLVDGMSGIQMLILDDQAVGIELPVTIDLEIIETSPGLKGASAQARTKPATLSNGLEVQVPEYLAQGEIVKINTETGKYVSRA